MYSVFAEIPTGDLFNLIIGKGSLQLSYFTRRIKCGKVLYWNVIGEERKMDYILDISTELFEQIKHHEISTFFIEKNVLPEEIKEGDALKLYHPGNKEEALRVLVKKAKPDGEIQFELLEWMFRMETELDELLREEKLWMEEML